MTRGSRALWRITRVMLIAFGVRAAFDWSVGLFGHPATWALCVLIIVALSMVDD